MVYCKNLAGNTLLHGKLNNSSWRRYFLFQFHITFDFLFYSSVQMCVFMCLCRLPQRNCWNKWRKTTDFNWVQTTCFPPATWGTSRKTLSGKYLPGKPAGFGSRPRLEVSADSLVALTTLNGQTGPGWECNNYTCNSYLLNLQRWNNTFSVITDYCVFSFRAKNLHLET